MQTIVHPLVCNASVQEELDQGEQLSMKQTIVALEWAAVILKHVHTYPGPGPS